jgi:peptide-methionine (S)-S-oxide reductase
MTGELKTRARGTQAVAAALAAMLVAGCSARQETHTMTATPNSTAGGAPQQGAAASAADTNKSTETATFAAGCFWGVEAAFRKAEGVRETAVGYTGGHTQNPTYKEVCSDTTGHAEAVQVTFDPDVVSYEDLLDVFWQIHDPTTPNRQGPDVGSQYRSAIFTHGPEQEAAARASKDALEQAGRFDRPIVTEIVPADTFWRAEDYHQRYLEKRGAATCHPSLR